MKIANKNKYKPKFCPINCRYLSPWEQYQSQQKESHICGKYNKAVIHGKFHPNLLMLAECNEYVAVQPFPEQIKIKINWWKVPFEIMAMMIMSFVWGSKATHRMVKSEITYQNNLKGD